MENETNEQKIVRLEAVLRAIATTSLTGVDFGDWVQMACEEALEGLWPECPKCGTAVHEGACIQEEEVA